MHDILNPVLNLYIPVYYTLVTNSLKRDTLIIDNEFDINIFRI